MTFLNATLLIGIAAAAVPILLHLLSKREPKRVVFPALRLLTRHYESNRSRLQVRRWWLLALRVLMLAALALALARPVIDRALSITWLTIGLVTLLGVSLLVMASVALLRGNHRTTGYSLALAAGVALLTALGWGGYTAASGSRPQIEAGGPIALAVVLDNGPTSQWKSLDDDRIERLRGVAAWLIARIPATSRIAVLDRSAVPAAFSIDKSGAISKLESLRPLQVTEPIGARLDAAARLLRTSELNDRHVVVVSDLAVASWSEDERPAELPATVSSDPKVAVTVVDLGNFNGSNRSLSLPRLTDPTPPRGTSLPLSATVRVSSANLAESIFVGVELQLIESDPSLPVLRDGVIVRPSSRRVDRTSVRVTPGTEHEVVLAMPPLEVGTHHGVIALIGDDSLVLDDQRYVTLNVLPPSALLIVSDHAEEAAMLGAAITAPFELDDPVAEFAVERVGFADLPVVRLTDFEAVFLLDPPAAALDDPMLERFVIAGGSLLVALGPAAGDKGLETALMPKLVRPFRQPLPGTFLEVIRPQQPIFAPLAELSEQVRWSDYRVHLYWQLQAQEQDSVLAQFAGTTHPAVVERTLGQGRVLTIATPLPALAAQTRDWNELFSAADAWPAFVLVRQIAEQLTSRQAYEASSPIGTPVPVTLPRATPPGADSDLPAAGGNRRWQLFPPGDASPVPLVVAAEAKEVVVTDVPVVGTYWLRGSQTATGFSANLNLAATSLERIDRSELDQWFGLDNYNVVTDQEEIELNQLDQAASVSLHAPAMLLALILFLLEQILSNRFYRGAAEASKSTGAIAA